MEKKPSPPMTSTREIDIIVIVKALSLDARLILGEVFEPGASNYEKPAPFALSPSTCPSANGFSVV
ncbi:hypothetical protein PAECIP111802_01878 [Paenibacillus allorhizosphaerae]|uniref:Uncharacterized protein n=1 Tax=Paenibacillus allorhizosphaerae TaxID=2849866 RepID=A0ABN7TIL8_9BACL|nr:hypothetical protein PAECIP111802_01878 [Paenibacillus allorhizosphaerae]